MASALDQQLRPGERVIYRTPRHWPPRYQRWHGLTFLALGLGYFAIDQWTAFDWGSLMTPRLIGWSCVVFIVSVVNVARQSKTEVAVTDQRVLHVDKTGEQLKVHSVELADVGAIDVDCAEVEVTKHDGKTVALDCSGHADNIGLILAQAAGLPPAQLPGGRARFAFFAVIVAGFGGFLTAYAASIRILTTVGLWGSFPLCLLAIPPAIGAGLAAWALTELLALIVVRCLFGRAEIEACYMFYGLKSRDTAKSDEPGWVDRVRLRLFELVFSPPLPREARRDN